MIEIDTHILLVDKPKGITSFDVIRRLRKQIGIWKMGHAGTLDPLATGLMIVGVGEGTKQLAALIKLPKVYEAEVLLGRRTTTGDMEGEVLEACEVKAVDEDRVRRELDGMVRVLTLQVPAYSAIKINGQPLYKRARKGHVVETPERQMEIKWVKFHSSGPFENGYVLKIELEVSSGSYIRSIAEELGRRLGYPATLKELRRTRVGDYKIENAMKIE